MKPKGLLKEMELAVLGKMDTTFNGDYLNREDQGDAYLLEKYKPNLMTI
jgi:hypothetical protein